LPLNERIRIVMTRVFEGPLHQRLYDIWADWADNHREVEVVWQSNDGSKCHQEMLEEIWDDHAEHCDVLVMTEHDFIPDDLLVNTLRARLRKSPAVLVQYATRNPQDLALIRHDCAGGWLMAFRPARFDTRPDFGGTDPGNRLIEEVYKIAGAAPTVIYGRNDRLGLKYGGMGTHLFWSRHINDNPNSYVAGFSVKEILTYWVERISEKEQA